MLNNTSAAALRETVQLALYSVNRSPYKSLALHNLNFTSWTLSYVQSGDLVTSAAGESWHVQTGDVMLHPPCLPFSEIAPGAGTHLWIAFDASAGTHLDIFRVQRVSPVVTIHDRHAYEETFAQLLDGWRHNEPSAGSFARTLRCLTLTLELFNLLLDSWERAGSVPRPASMSTASDRFLEVIQYMTDHLDEKLSRHELARRVHLHPSYFDQVFRAEYGVPPMQMLRDLRLQRAQRLLESSALSLAAIADRCGFADAAYFSRTFHQKLGQTPGAYRKAVESTKTAYIPSLSNAASLP